MKHRMPLDSSGSTERSQLHRTREAAAPSFFARHWTNCKHAHKCAKQDSSHMCQQWLRRTSCSQEMGGPMELPQSLKRCWKSARKLSLYSGSNHGALSHATLISARLQGCVTCGFACLTQWRVTGPTGKRRRAHQMHSACEALHAKLAPQAHAAMQNCNRCCGVHVLRDSSEMSGNAGRA